MARLKRTESRAGQPAQEATEIEEKQSVTVVPSSEVIERTFHGKDFRAVTKDGAPCFIVADLCRILEHSNPTQAVSRLDEDEKGVIIIKSPSGEQSFHVVTESGLFALILSSRKPQAKAFRKWVTSEVLPSIRRTGRYETSSSMTTVPPIPTDRVGRYTTIVIPGREITTYPLPIESALTEIKDLDAQLLAHRIKMIEVLWTRAKTLGCFGVDTTDGFSVSELHMVIQHGGRLASRYLGYPEGF